MSEGSVARSGTDDHPAEKDLTAKQRQILTYLQDNVHQQMFFKSRLIGDEVGLTASEVGTNIAQLQDAEIQLTIEQWGYSSSTTWEVRR